MKDEQTQRLDYVLRLRDTIKELEKENKRLQSDLENEKIVSQDFQEIIHELFQVNKQLREALEYYANSSIYGSGYICADIDVARRVLEEVS